MDWQQIAGSWVMIPKQPIGVIHFLGGAFVATAPQLTYRWLLEQLCRQGYIVVATPFVNTFEHQAIAESVLLGFDRVMERLYDRNLVSGRYFPIYGLGHSMGCKLHLLIGSLFPIERAGNILISFNNYPAKRAIPFLDQFKVIEQFKFVEQFNLTPAFNVEFSPSPAETSQLIAESYQVRRNLLIQFRDDTIDQTRELFPVLQQRFPNMVALQHLSGSHVTPLGQDIPWQAGKDFTPLDAIAQWMKQEAYRDLNQLKNEVIRWLNPTRSL